MTYIDTVPLGSLLFYALMLNKLLRSIDFIAIIIIIIIIIIVITIIIEFHTSQLWLGNIHLSWDVVINRIRFGGLMCSLKSFFTIEHVARITDFCSCMYVFGCKLSLVRLCDSDFGITPVDDITIGITCAAFCFHKARISFASPWCLFCLSAIVLTRLCVFGTAMSIKKGVLCFLIHKSYVRSIESH